MNDISQLTYLKHRYDYLFTQKEKITEQMQLQSSQNRELVGMGLYFEVCREMIDVDFKRTQIVLKDKAEPDNINRAFVPELSPKFEAIVIRQIYPKQITKLLSEDVKEIPDYQINKMISMSQVSRMTGQSYCKLYTHILRRRLPKPIRIKHKGVYKKVYFMKDDISRFMETYNIKSKMK